MATVTTPTIPTPIKPSAVPDALPVAPDPLSILMASRHRITLEEYRRMAEAGVLGLEPKVELIEGMLVEKMTKNPPHNLACDLIQEVLSAFMPAGYFVSMATSMTIDDRQGEPEPDAWVLRGTRRDYAGRARTPADSALVVEVAESSYGLDRGVKAAVYASCAIPIYWIVDLNRRRLEVLTKPAPIREGAPAAYEDVRVFEADDEVPLVLDGREVGRLVVREILP
ncbi:Uma2 family endonuclease [Aquisphaera insulae]|uniref:Uma2 family endonuclease n=1 Tax=Aquisphaera insulae TaxID=2712864 RepID=UPI0013EC5007|nr:Uma2 family endonuclease [Aquisphaera insulae]